MAARLVQEQCLLLLEADFFNSIGRKRTFVGRRRQRACTINRRRNANGLAHRSIRPRGRRIIGIDLREVAVEPASLHRAVEAPCEAQVLLGILLAERCLKAGATVIGPNGKPFTRANIGGAIATRAIMADLRAGAGITNGPSPFARSDRSRFLQALDEALVRLAK